MTSRTITLTGFAIIVVAAVVLELRARRRPGTPGARDALAAARSIPVGRWALLLGWLWLGWHVFAR